MSSMQLPVYSYGFGCRGNVTLIPVKKNHVGVTTAGVEKTLIYCSRRHSEMVRKRKMSSVLKGERNTLLKCLETIKWRLVG
jgi:hypothetical protein